MICTVIKGPTYREASIQIAQSFPYADLVELRLDGFTSCDLSEIKNLRTRFDIPMIFTFRSSQDGGNSTQSEKERLKSIDQLLTLNPEYLDLEHHVSSNIIDDIASKYPHTKIILSYHNFEKTPENLEEIYQEMHKTKASFYKIATTAHHSLDALRFFCFAAEKKDPTLIAISMGMHGQFSRILGPIIRCPMTYAAIDENQTNAPGQLPASTLIQRYHHNHLNPSTKIYGLIGDPVSQSISDITHNAVIQTFDIDAVYVKIPVSSSELPQFLHFAKQLPFHGLSVTMPLKEAILPLLDAIDPEAKKIGAVNTLSFEKGKIFGCNTDGMGALNAIERECSVKEKHVVILGAGGAAKAIAYEAHQRGASITILNRDKEKAIKLAQQMHCRGFGIDEMSHCAALSYDILINSTPVPLPINPENIMTHAIVMDIKTKPKETLFLQHAKNKGCVVIYGYNMFLEQALGQFQLWFEDKIDLKKSRKILEESIQDCSLE